jgi:cyclase
MPPRVIPCLLIQESRLVKTTRFKHPVYIGDPVNAVRIFSEKEADEIVILDIDASKHNREPNFNLIAEMAGEAFMPVSYGGGVRTFEQIRRLIRSGVEKVVINTAATIATDVIKEAVAVFGSQAIVGGIDVRRKLFGGYTVMSHSGTIDTKLVLHSHIDKLLKAGVGELFINDINSDGTMRGFDVELVRSVSNTQVPVVVCGGAGSIQHLLDAIQIGGASAVAAGSLFVFYGKHRAVLINYPKSSELIQLFNKVKNEIPRVC